MNGPDRQRVANTLERARLLSWSDLQEAFDSGKKPDRLDVLVVAQWYDSALAGQTRGPMGYLKAHGPTLGIGAGGGAILIAIIQGLGQVLGK